ncbi:MAG TPA: outer membrane beta-barrel protein, partial [Xanthobacteraceae bacterium]|nr:outer membrane beta-barrel protein [Xanthobacteraceae bacterium]
MRRLFSTCLVTCLFAGMGQAVVADIPAPVLKAPAVVAPATSWTGVYAGASLGGRWSDADWTTTAIAAASGLGLGPSLTGPDPSTASPPFNAATVRAGIFYGYNWQIGSSWVVGLESDLAWGNSRKTISGVPGTYGTTLGGIASSVLDSTQVKAGWDASSRVRAGYLVMPNVLAYVTAGVATDSVSTTATCSAAGPWCAASAIQTDRWTKVGWTAGGGVEARLWGNWLGRAEYRYADYGTISDTVFANTVQSVSYDVKLRTQTGLVGLAYQFDRSLFESLAGSLDGATGAPAAIYKARPIPVAAWTGAYAGVSAGGRWSSSDWTTTGIEVGGNLNGTTQPDPSSATASFGSSTFRFGGYAGYLWQLSPHWVIGTEADIAWGNGSKTIAGILGTIGPATGFTIGPADSTSVKEGWDSSYLTRVG